MSGIQVEGALRSIVASRTFWYLVGLGFGLLIGYGIGR